MRPPPSPAAHRAALAAALAVLAAGVVHAAAVGPATPTATATVSAARYGRPIPAGFLGLSLEYSALEAYAGSDPARPNPRFLALVRDLAPGQRSVLRIGGDSADWTWWPAPGLTKPAGVSYTLTPRWLAVAAALTRALHARLILGLNLQANSGPVAAAEARALLDGLPAGSIEAFELGNEPNLYGVFPWYRTASGRPMKGRPPHYTYADFQSDFTRVAAALPAHALAGPSIGGPGWLPDLKRFLAAEPAVRLVTVHHYPLQLCLTSRRSSRYPTIAHVLSPAASTGLAAEFTQATAVAHARGLPLRIDELNTVSCGAAPRVSQSPASALWALDTLFALARTGVDGVQMHTFPGAGYELFHINGRQATLAPEYHGLRMFAAAAPPGARLLRTRAHGASLRLWATLAPDRRIRVLAINPSRHRTERVGFTVAGASGVARLQRLNGATTTLEPPYAITMPPVSAALLTLSER